MAATVTTPWGTAVLVEQVQIEQEAGSRAFGSVVQLLEAQDGARFVRFAYTTDGQARRGPVTLRTEDLEQLAERLSERSALRRLLRMGVGR
jgi:hypothetical protein